MIDGTAIEALAERFKKPFHAVDPLTAWPTIIVVGGRTVLMAPDGWSEYQPMLPSVRPLEVGTLDAVPEYLRANKDNLPLDKLVVHVAGPTTVRILGPLSGEEDRFRRQCYLEAEARIPKIPFGQYLESEAFGIILRTCFVDAPTVQEVVALVASIRESDVRETVDDGVAQEVKVLRGVALVDRQRVPSPVLLAPFRTFAEVVQPESPFILRLRSGVNGGPPTCALWEADGGAWRIRAMEAVAGYLWGMLEGSLSSAGVRIIS